MRRSVMLILHLHHLNNRVQGQSYHHPYQGLVWCLKLTCGQLCQKIARFPRSLGSQLVREFGYFHSSEVPGGAVFIRSSNES